MSCSNENIIGSLGEGCCDAREIINLFGFNMEQKIVSLNGEIYGNILKVEGNEMHIERVSENKYLHGQNSILRFKDGNFTETFENNIEFMANKMYNDHIRSRKHLNSLHKDSNDSLMYSIILDVDGYVCDGWHRIVKAIVNGDRTIMAIRLESMPAPIPKEEEE